ncbi:uncharacterized protein LOC120193228 [Hibiscus syriacus]|uniref:uncharacterized protein LOC120193228 n=1 Tax=Hibiscus syriacus TaxID=106335 RepID=UPI0019207BFE|nr:uncharacterized protein LOC120193228 [Hibiscus syriacus]
MTKQLKEFAVNRGRNGERVWGWDWDWDPLMLMVSHFLDAPSHFPFPLSTPKISRDSVDSFSSAKLTQADGHHLSLGLGFLESSKLPLQPPPPSIEVFSSEISSSMNYTMEPVNLGGLTLLKGRVSTDEVLGLHNSDLVPGIYEGYS